MFTSLLNKTAEIQTLERTQGLTGETTEAWVTRDSYPCRYEKSAAPRVFDAEYKATLRDFIFFFDKGVVVRNHDRILVDGYTFDVVGSHNIDGMLNPHVEVLARVNDTSDEATPVAAYVPVAPTVVTLGPASFNSNSIQARIEITDEGEYTIEEAGIVWEQGSGESTPAEDTLPENSGYNNEESVVGAYPPGVYQFNMAGLNDNQQYAYRAWVRSGNKYFYSTVQVEQVTTQAQTGGGSGGGGAI
jgi:hypothetical protein